VHFQIGIDADEKLVSYSGSFRHTEIPELELTGFDHLLLETTTLQNPASDQLLCLEMIFRRWEEAKRKKKEGVL
jgi:hypothetical protein